jgi:hypothetical protein
MNKAIAVLFVMTAACSGQSDENPAASNPSGATVPSGASQESSAPSAPGSSASTKPSDTKPADNGTPADALKSGAITVIQTWTNVAGTTTPTFAAVASFFDTSASDDTCTHTTAGACTVDVCNVPSTVGDPPANPSAEAAPPATVKAPSAGEITVTALQTLTLSPDTAGNYSSKTGKAELFQTGGAIAISAAGADVPAFQKSITAPSSVTITSPTLTVDASLPLDRSKDFAFSWSDGTAGEVGITVSAATPTRAVTILCTYPASAGTATIPTAVLGKLDATSSGNLSIDTHSKDSVDVGGWHIITNASRPARAGTAFAAGPVEVQ